MRFAGLTQVLPMLYSLAAALRDLDDLNLAELIA